MSIKTTTLETSKLLKENGFRQDTYFCWGHEMFPVERIIIKKTVDCPTTNIACAATTDELLEELPDGVRIYKAQGEFNIFLTNAMPPFISHEILPEALSILWLFLKKEGLI